MTFGEKLVSLRESRDVSRKELATYLDIPYTTLRNYEKDEREAGHILLCKVADFFGVSVDYLLGVKEKAPAMQELSKEHLILIQHFDQASRQGKELILALAEFAAAASRVSLPADQSDEALAQENLSELALRDSLSKGQVEKRG